MAAEESGNKIVEALHELNVQTIVSIPKIGPFDFSITNAVIYMWVVGHRGVRLLLHRRQAAEEGTRTVCRPWPRSS